MTSMLLLAFNSQAAFFIVDRHEDAPDVTAGNGTCEGQNMVGDVCSLRAAIMESNALPGPDTILVPAGKYDLTVFGDDENNGFTGDLDITDEVTIINGTSGIVIDGLFADRIFHVHAGGQLNLENVTLQNGYANTQNTFEGGAVKVEDSAAFLTNEVTFINNLANRGGALFSDGNVTIENSYFHHNAITNEHTPQNLNSVGSAIVNRELLLFATSTVANNGQLLSNPQNVVLSQAQYAMHFNPNGLNATPPASFIFNSTIAFNGYAGIRSDRGFTDINQSTIAHHETRGIRFTRNENHDGVLQLKIRGSLLVNNEFKNCNDIWVLPEDEVDVINNYNGSSDESCGFTGMDDIENITNPLNGSLHNWGGFAPTLMLTPESQAIDHAGNNCSNEDQRGSSRPVDGNNNMVSSCDMGAVEFNPLTDPNQSDLIFKNNFEALF